MDLDIEIGIELIEEGNKKERDDKLFQMWNLERLFMDSDNFQGFDEYKKQMSQPVKVPVKSKVKTKEEIYAQADKIIAAWKKGGCTHGTV